MLREVQRTYRGLIRRPAFFGAVVLTMALGIGANSAIVSVIDAILLKPLPYPGADRLMGVFETNLKLKTSRSGVAPGRLEEWNRMNASFAGLAGAYTENMADTSGALPEKFVTARVSPRFFSVLATPPLVGRGLSPEEDQPNGPAAALISERLWKRRFNGDPGVTSQTLRFAGRGYSIVGVLPNSFSFPASDVDVWMPAQFGAGLMRSRNARFYVTVGRLRDGVAAATASADLVAVQARLSAEFPGTDGGWSALVEPLKEQTVAGVRRSLWILFGAVSLVLLIACSNVACLLLAQASRREREIAVRFSLGARRAQVVGGLLLEAVCAALPGAVLGLLIAVAGSRWFRVAAANLPRAEEIHVDWRIVAFTFSATIATAIAFGLLPALQATRGSLAHGGRSVVGGRQRLLRTLVAAQIALAIVLLVGAGLLIRTMARIGQASLGFNPENVLTLRMSASWSERGPLVAQRLSRTLEALATIPGVTGSALTVSLPGTGKAYPQPVSISGYDRSQILADLQSVSPAYFRLLGIPLLMGETCRITAAEPSVVPLLVNRSFVDRFLDGRNPLLQRVKTPNREGEIIGVVSDVREHGYTSAPEPVIYGCGIPWYFPDPSFLIRTAGDPSMLVETVRRRMQEAEPNRAVYEAKPLTAHLSASLGEKRFQTILLSLFGATALLLAAVGLYGVTSFFVSQRRREIGLRAALGAQPSQLLGHVFRQGGLTAAIGLGAGLGAAAVVTRSISAMLFGVGPLDPVTFVFAPLLLAAVAGLALWVPAHRAARIDPMEALREE